MSDGFIQRSKKTVVAASGSDAGLGKITTLVAAGVNYIRLDLDRNVSKVDWIVKANKVHAVQPYLAETNCTGGTLTFTDATGVDDEDSFIFNALTYIAEATEAQVDITNREWLHATQAGGAAALAVLLAHSTYGVPGIGAITVTAPTTTDVLTIGPGRAPIYQFNQGTSAANEIAWSETTLAGLMKHGSATTGIAANNTTAGTVYEQWTDGAPYAYLAITNSDAADPMTYSVDAVRYWV